MSMLCSQCGAPAERCARCASALCARRLCAELHEVSCSAVSALPVGQIQPPARSTYVPRQKQRRARSPEAESQIAQHLVLRITQHRQAGRSALLAGDLDTAFDELWAARLLEPDLDCVGATARDCMPREWELETDLTPLARALSARLHPRAADAWRRLLDDRPARSVQAEAAEWLAREAFGSGNRRPALRILHAASLLGRSTGVAAFHVAYRQAGLDPVAAFSLYLAASRIDTRTARAADRLPDVAWPWYRLAELLAWAGFGERARDHLAQAERRTLGRRDAERTTRPLLRALVHAGLGSGPDGLPTATRPFPAEPFGLPLAWRLKFR